MTAVTPNSTARLQSAQDSAKNSWKIAHLTMLLLGLSFLAGCQGLSAGSPAKESQQQVGTLALANASMDFGSVVAGATKTLTVTVTNSGSAAVTVNSASVSNNNFSVTAPSFPANIAAGQSATLSLAFTPNAVGSFSATVTVASNASDSTATISLSGTGIAAGQLASNPSTEAFGSVTVGSQQSISETVTNTGGTSVTVSQAAITGTGFSLSGINTPMTISAGQSTIFTVVFAPQIVGAASGHVTLTSNAPNATLTIPLSGTGIAPGQLSGSPSSKAFGSVTVGSQQTASETVTNTGGTSVIISQAAVGGTGFSLSGLTTPTTLAAGQSATFTVAFAPQAIGSASGSVTLSSDGANPTLTIPLSGTGVAAGQLTGNPSSEDFGSVTVGSLQTASETITNTGGSSVSVSQITVSGTGFSLSGNPAPITLIAGQSATFTVGFTPQATGAASGNVKVSSNASNSTLTITLSGTGASPQAGQLSVSPSTLALGNVVVGQSGTASGSLTASGGSVTVTAASTNNSAFSVGGLSLPVSIPSGQSTAFTITFSPQTAASASATLTITSNALSSTTTETLTGTGTPAPTHSVNLSWTASTSTDVVGYNVYRAVYGTSACGAFSKINPVLTTATLYTDSTVANSTAYCYATTAVDTSNAESSYSNIVSNVAIP
jgi:HYDIN/CFA65/VesB-like, Ig-like domain/Cep192 domain 4